MKRRIVRTAIFAALLGVGVAAPILVKRAPASGESISAPVSLGVGVVVPAAVSTVAPIPLWPFTSMAEEQRWEHGTAHPEYASPQLTANKFTTVHLGYREIVYVNNIHVSGSRATVGVAFKIPGTTRTPTAAVLSLVKLGRGWTVVGSVDTFLTLTLPAYGSRIVSPVVVGGRIWGVDESLVAKIDSKTQVLGRTPTPGLAAGGQGSQYFLRLAYVQPVSGTPMAVIISTGGHVATVERFAIVSVRQR